jgi:DNA-binding transcriptional LysR family regulator
MKIAGFVKLVNSSLPIQKIYYTDMRAYMNLKQLEIFVTIATTGSFSKGAEAACITQSTASQHIATLEDFCGVRLFDRTGRGVMTTEAGKIMLAHAQQVIKSLKEAEQAILQFRRADGVELRVGGSTIPGTYLLPQAVAALRASDPGIIVKVGIGDSSEILAKLVAEDIEIGIVGTAASGNLFTTEALGHDEILLIARKDHPWCSRREIHPAELLPEPIIMREAGSGTNDVVAASLRLHGIKTSDFTVCATISSSEAIKQAVLAGCGVAFISELAVRGELKQGVLVSIPLADCAIVRSFSLVCRKGRTLSPAGAAFAALLRQMNP